ncbi:response regulator [Sessilibacter sp. MAH2]
MRGAPINILLVEDDIVDKEMFLRTLKKNTITNPLIIASNGEEAVEILSTRLLDKPLLIILDLNMPRMTGLEFLHELRLDNHYADSVVFVMTTSAASSDKKAVSAYDIAGFLVKSEMGEQFSNVFSSLLCYFDIIDLEEGQKAIVLKAPKT